MGKTGKFENTRREILQDRAIRLCKFLRELALLKTKVVRDLSAYETVVWFSDIPDYKGCASILGPDPQKPQEPIWLEIRQFPAPKRPSIPSSLERWTEKSFNETDLYAKPVLRRSNPTPPYEIIQQWNKWENNDWNPWVKSHSAWTALDKVYFSLFSIHQQLKKLGEQYELLLGLGLLTWQTPDNQIISRHIVVGDTQLVFDASRANFELQASPDGVKLRFETDMIEQSDLPGLEQMNKLESALSQTQESPWNKAEIDQICKGFVNSISPHGTYSDSITPPDKPRKEPIITFAPAIILRARTQRSQIQCINTMISQIAQGEEIPPGIETLCANPQSVQDGDEGVEVEGVAEADQQVYLPLLANEEQKQIIYRIRNQKGILVQGPPGTGKSHTIANIVCHLLAEGKRVLITSQTPRALKVLKEKIPIETQALCVTLLGNDQVARRELEKSVGEINQRYSNWDPGYSKRLIVELEEHLYKLKKEKADTARLLRETREINSHKYDLASGNYRGTAQQIANQVAQEERTFVWLEDNILGELTCPLSNTELRNLLQLYRELPEDYCVELNQELVSSTDLPNIEDFINIIEKEREARLEMAKFESRQGSIRYRGLQKLAKKDLELLSKSILDLLAAKASLKHKFPWVDQAVNDILANNFTFWDNLQRFMADHLSRSERKISIAQTLEVTMAPNLDRKKLMLDARNLLNHFENGGAIGFGFLAPKIVRQNRYVMEKIKVNGRTCETIHQLQLLNHFLEATHELDQIWSALQGLEKREGGSLQLQFRYLKERLETVNQLHQLKNLLDNAKQCLKAAPGVIEPLWDRAGELEALVEDIQAVETESTLRNVILTLEQAIRKIRIIETSPKSHQLNREILGALEKRDAEAFARCLAKLKELEKGRVLLVERQHLCYKLRIAAPKIEIQLQHTFQDNCWNDRVTQFEAAWQWKIADNWVKQFGKEHNEATLDQAFNQLVSKEQKLTSSLAAAKAWDNCLRRLTPLQRANLMAWAHAVKRMPKTLTARTRPKWLKEAQQAMDNCREAIPAWIMPLYRVFETIPPKPECFDIVIVDEASQTGPEGLILQYLAKQCIIVGDSQQISPESIGVPEEATDALIKKYLDGVPFKGFYNPATSLFAFAEILYRSKIVLREHFRCMPEIIEFSNRLCYTGTPLKPLRQYPPNRLEPIVLHHIVQGYREGSANNVLNRAEADAIVQNIVHMCSAKEYAGKTIGVISLQGESQAKYIESKLLTRLSPIEMESRRIVCGDAYAFQGDERDVICLSMVAAPNEKIGALVKESDKRRFNVAASRAKDQVILFHTATLSDLHPECMRYALLEYYLNPTKRPVNVDMNVLESQFERDVCQAIINKGYKVIPQHKVAEYRIDMVVEGLKSQLAVECDGDEWHGPEFYERDMARQRILERGGWRFWRIRGSEYYRYPEASLNSLWDTLVAMEIYPEKVNATPQDPVISKSPTLMESDNQRKLPSRKIEIPKTEAKFPVKGNPSTMGSKLGDRSNRFEDSIRTPFPDEYTPALPFLREANRLEKEGATQDQVEEVLKLARMADPDATAAYLTRWDIIKKRNSR